MTDLFETDIEWLARDCGSPVERAAFGALRMAVGDLVLTEAFDLHAKTVRERARVSLLTLGRWVAENWWRLRWEPDGGTNDWRLSHQLAAAGDGFLWPPMTISCDGEFVSLRGEPQKSSSQPLRYVQSYDLSVPASEFERALDGLMSVILARLEACETPTPDLNALWAEVMTERVDSEMSALRRHEAMLGLDPDAVPSEEIDDLVASGRWMGEDALHEVMSATGHTHFYAAERQLQDWSQNGALSVDLSSLCELGGSTARSGEPHLQAWERGASIARAVREGLGLGIEPVDTKTVCELLDADVIAVSSSDSSDARMAVGFRAVDEPDRLRTVLTKPHPRARRFEVARLMADAIIAQRADTVLPVTAKNTVRQKTQRAFAQEFLCPVEAIRSHLDLPRPDEAEISAFAELYDVSEWTVISAAVNQKLVSRDYLVYMR